MPERPPCIVNPDAIAVGLAGAAELGAIPAGKLALEAQRRYVSEQADFAMETTLSGRRWTRFLEALSLEHYRVSLYFLWMPDPALCVARVQSRVMLGGHGIPESDIRRRYESGLRPHLASRYGRCDVNRQERRNY